jgi:hypothetical protein
VCGYIVLLATRRGAICESSTKNVFMALTLTSGRLRG